MGNPPSRFQDTLHLFNDALAKELRELQLNSEAILELVDDSLTYIPSKEDSDENTNQILKFLGKWGYRISST